ncbi:bifunctional hydroxymethylpyrimidine kinase/phosphomethylpyrimidine kinase [Selenomonas sp. TAMA-11512]|uniref:bifunctional hydroxymethylpyrimidine kinase/phosphomethylpyrimidine kinase n=1 Tax=Selenomonas sp. TAMA-11512 TaxID=3095337 RepID=UPI00309214AD|nr:bifunctional hydroxymethylpyrimidine kinase/phosphomethylpyrimidine kinase [Selenomonas sp. TAMA-11512]
MKSADYRERLGERLKLYAVTDRVRPGSHSLQDDVEEALFGGITMLQMREKTISDAEFLTEARALQALCRKHDVPFIVNDRVDIAVQLGADGIHVGQEDMTASDVRARIGKDMLLGVSCHSVEEACAAEASGADYLGVGAVFQTTTKPDTTPISADQLQAIVESVSVPVVAIGGITRDNMSDLRHRGLAGVALVSAIFGAADIRDETKRLRRRAEALTVRTALTIAGSDSSGGAGIQADLKAMMSNNVYGMSAITALTAQNTQGVQGIHAVDPDFIAQEIDSVFTDIVPDAVKIGMLANRELITAIREKLLAYNARNIVLDPVMVSTSGAKLLEDDAIETLQEALFPLAAVITPNIPEAELLLGTKIGTEADMETAAKRLYEEHGAAVLLKGGHNVAVANDVLCDADGVHWYRSEHIANPNTHGTGCTLSSAIAANLAKGYPLSLAVREAKAYVHESIQAMLDLGKGAGPLLHQVRM